MFYHISINKLEGEQLNFVPRIPSDNNRLKDENTTIPRICVSTSIIGCLNAVKGVIAEQVILKEYSNCSIIKVPIYIYGIEKDKISINDIVDPIELRSKSYVEDALKNDEHWILKPVKLEYIQTIVLDDMDMHVVDIDYEDEDEEDNIYPYIDYYDDFKWRWRVI